MRSVISGGALPVLEIALDPGETIVAETGQLSWMSGSVVLATTTASAGAGGFLGAMTRAFGGGGLFMTEYTAGGGVPGEIAFAAHVPGAIVELDVSPAGPAYMVHRHGSCARRRASFSAPPSSARLEPACSAATGSACSACPEAAVRS